MGLRSRSYGIEIDRATGKVVREHETVMCGHCAKHTDLEPPKNAQVVVRVATCPRCKRPICNYCQPKLTCVVWEEKMARYEQRQRLLAAAAEKG